MKNLPRIPAFDALEYVSLGIVKDVLKMKVLSLDEFDSMTADLEKTKKDLEVMTVAEKKATDEAAANLSQFKDMEQQKIGGDKEQDAMKTTISELHGKIASLEKEVADAKEYTATFIGNMIDDLQGKVVAIQKEATGESSPEEVTPPSNATASGVEDASANNTTSAEGNKKIGTKAYIDPSEYDTKKTNTPKKVNPITEKLKEMREAKKKLEAAAKAAEEKAKEEAAAANGETAAANADTPPAPPADAKAPATDAAAEGGDEEAAEKDTEGGEGRHLLRRR